MSEERSIVYKGRRAWLISAGVSLLGTTSTISTLILTSRDGLPEVLEGVAEGMAALFFVVALWMSLVGGGSLLLRLPGEDFGTVTLRGRSVPRRVWMAVLGVCYLAPWIAVAALAGAFGFSS